LGWAVSQVLATVALGKRKAVWYILSVVLPCLYSLLAVFVFGLVQDRGLDVPATLVFATIFLSLGWSYAWLNRRTERQTRLARLVELGRRIAEGQQHIDQWERNVAELDGEGHDTKEAATFLENFRRSLNKHIASRDRVLKELE
jgi:hypothetical protein